MRRVLALAACLALWAPALAAAQSLDDVVRGLEAAYSKMTDLRADFAQQAFNKSLDQTIPAQGTVYLKRGGKLRWEYTEPTPQQIVSAGRKLPRRPRPAARAVQRPLPEPRGAARRRR